MGASIALGDIGRYGGSGSAELIRQTESLSQGKPVRQAIDFPNEIHRSLPGDEPASRPDDLSVAHVHTMKWGART